eukprot:s387_g6.t1
MMSISAVFLVLLAGLGLAVRQSGRDQPDSAVHEAEHEKIRMEKIGDVVEGGMELQGEWPFGRNPDACPRRSEVWSPTGKTLGQGQNGKVLEVTGSGHTGPYALKVPIAPEAEEDAQLEIAVMNSASSKHCTNVMHLTAEKPCVQEGSSEKKVNSKAYVAPEMAGDLDGWVKQASLAGRQLCAERIIKQVTDGMECLHKAGYIHGDLKADNIFYKERRGDILRNTELDSQYCPSGVVLADFGLSAKINTQLWQYDAKYYRYSTHLPSSLFVGHRDSLNIKLPRQFKVFVREDIDKCSLQELARGAFKMAVKVDLQWGRLACLRSLGPGTGASEKMTEGAS